MWGRNQETYGEDPYLSGATAINYVKGLQGDHPRYIITNAGCKHFDGKVFQLIKFINYILTFLLSINLSLVHNG